MHKVAKLEAQKKIRRRFHRRRVGGVLLPADENHRQRFLARRLSTVARSSAVLCSEYINASNFKKFYECKTPKRGDLEEDRIQEMLTIPRGTGSNYFIPNPDLCAVHRAPGPSKQSKIVNANVLTRNTTAIALTAYDANVPFVNENPPASHLWAVPCMQNVAQLPGAFSTLPRRQALRAELLATTGRRPNAKGRLRGALSLGVSIVYG